MEHLARLEYQVETLEHNPNIIIMDSLKELNEKWFSLTGKDKHIYGFYSYPGKTIYLRKHGSFNTVKHEYLHYYLHQLCVPVENHHRIIDN
ncbi:MAG: hypothetical protein GY714_18365 [Desulfobacterales bacterium]|nr:hypothetical protein [Desulfobacterales bacterium]